MATKTHSIICEGVISADQPGDTTRVVRWVERVTTTYDFANYLLLNSFFGADGVYIVGPDVPEPEPFVEDIPF